ncbi:hypothetical protein [Streptomyces melanogenes]|uniref:Secreted protein n=1 Tax=Streptomyces melanogenes TaxID=67326 RepID=A0ABZ1XX32_9ACTN|nr:hypothetical protein [Streptomyces melanogenes]
MNRSRIALPVAIAVLAAGVGVAAARETGADQPSEPRSLHFVAHFGQAVTVPAKQWGKALVTCPSGWAPTGGGGEATGTDLFITISRSTVDGWYIGGMNTGSQDRTLTALVDCSDL